ncbi:MAG: NAD-dependent epimerase/dehydratase family protein [Balneolaceae bacterium]
MNTFVTGGTGFIGSHLVDYLLEDKNTSNIKCLIRNHEKWLKGKDYIPVRGDLHNISVLQKALENVDIVYHLAGVVMASSQKEFDRANVEATENILRVAQKSGVKKMIILSSLAAAGPSNGRPLIESDPMNPISKYGESKKKMELMIHNSADDLSVSILRPPAVYGPREDQIYTFFKLMSYGISPMVGDGSKPKISMVYVQDVIQGIVKAAEHASDGINTYFISGTEIYNWNYIRDTTNKVLGKKTVPIRIKPKIVKKIASVIETSASVFGKYPVFNKEKANEMIHEWTCSNAKAIEELGYHPEYSLEEGISRTIHWYKKHHWL